jgi:hypothetical protein
MTLPYPIDPALPSNPNPFFNDNSFVRGSQFRSNNAQVWANFNGVETDIATLQSYVDNNFSTLRSQAIVGFIPINSPGDTRNDVNWSSGDYASSICYDDTFTAKIVFNSSMTKQSDAAWAAGNNAGAFLTSTYGSASRSSTGTTRTLVFSQKHGLSINALISVSGMGNSAYNIASTAVLSTPDEFTITYTAVGSLSEGSTPDTGGTISTLYTAPNSAYISQHWYVLMKADGTVDFGYGLCAKRINLPATYIYKRYIGPLLTLSGVGLYLFEISILAGDFVWRKWDGWIGSTFTTNGTGNTESTHDLGAGVFPSGVRFVTELNFSAGNAAAWGVYIMDLPGNAPTTVTNVNGLLGGIAGARDANSGKFYAKSFNSRSFIISKGSIASISVGWGCREWRVSRAI